MAISKAIYITVRLDVESDKVDSINDEDIQEIISGMDYNFSYDGDFKIIDTEICDPND